jgi:hypothetical protein
MNTIIKILLFLIPVSAYLQKNWCNFSPSAYMWKNIGNAGFSTGQAGTVRIAFNSDSGPFVGYIDGADSGKVTVMQYNGFNWVNVGNIGFSTGKATCLSLVVSPSGEPYVAYSASNYPYKTYIVRFNGTDWVRVGQSDISEGWSTDPCLAFNNAGDLYLAYNDQEWDGASLLRFDGTNWVNVGNRGFSSGNCTYTRLAFDSSGDPYVAYCYYDKGKGNGGMLSMKRFDGTTWVKVGNDSSYFGNTAGLSFTFGPDDVPYVSYVDLNSYEAKVAILSGNNWANVGDTGFYTRWNWSTGTTLAFDSTGVPYLGFIDGINHNKATVKKFNGTKWVNVGDEGFSKGSSNDVDVKFNPVNGKPYIALSNNNDSLTNGKA